MTKQELLDLLRGIFMGDHAAFRDLIVRILDEGHLSAKDIADCTGESEQAVMDWTKGRDLPLPISRPAILGAIAKRLENPPPGPSGRSRNKFTKGFLG